MLQNLALESSVDWSKTKSGGALSGGSVGEGTYKTRHWNKVLSGLGGHKTKHGEGIPGSRDEIPGSGDEEAVT